MAARDRNQFAMQAYVITMTIVSVGLLIALGYYIFKDGTNSTTASTAVAAKADADAKLKTTLAKLEVFQAMLGSKQLSESAFSEFKAIASSDKNNPDISSILKEFETDMAILGPTGAKEGNYKNLVNALKNQLRDRNKTVELSRRTEKALRDDIDKITDRETKKSNEALQAKDALAKELVSVRTKADKDVVEQQALQQKATKSLEDSRSDMSKMRAEKDSRITSLLDEIQKLGTRNSALAIEIQSLQQMDFERAQGRVSDVDKGGVLVWISLGSEDKLVPGVKFSVIGRDEYRIKDAKKKATIEVVKIVGPGTAQAMVKGEKKGMPVIPGDQIYSPVWRPGRITEFALLGRMDINNDGKDDRAMIRDLIKKNGGIIVEDVDGDGIRLDENGRPVAGIDGQNRRQVSANTKYLVIGELFRDRGITGTLDDKQKKIAEVHADLESRARGMGLIQMNASKLLDWLQGDNEDRVSSF